ncbi:MAG: heterodisulfide reductase-related iron-sulfur binding cluster [candidate division WOR-3 bacterium]
MVQRPENDLSSAGMRPSESRADYALFWGCQIPARLPFLEKGIRALLSELAIFYRDLPDFTCCPERSFVANLDPSLWLLTAARNLALVESMGLDLLTPCSGCYATFREAIHTMRVDNRARQEIQAALQRMGLQWNDRTKVVHLATLIHDTLGRDGIKASSMHNLRGLRIAVHYGCNLLLSQGSPRFDHPSRPSKLDQLVEVLGGTSVEYETKGECCGESLGRTAGMGEARIMARRKLAAMRASEVDAILVACPACFMQFDTQQALMTREGEDFRIPVLYLSELLGLCLRLSPEQLGLSFHRTPITAFYQKWAASGQEVPPLPEPFDREALTRCLSCSACLNDCPVALTCANYRPDLLIEMLLKGDLEGCLAQHTIWFCLECHRCSHLCPQRYSWEKVLGLLKQRAMREGKVPMGVREGADRFLQSGRLVDPSPSSRTRLGLPEAQRLSIQIIKELKEKR